ncbi:hypothetical protein PIB30_009119 [Stylosanthes scabra]|uniref:Pentatricopeptide repeat-containing protein n=1 Tax=Stylosanthes scabra TaxID=79078 RepID=A0ABU6X6H8_9FABA|nr:hypothetical protein [Stylosanthes scabra]
MLYDAALKVFDGMPQRNVFSWTVMIVASNEHGFYLDGLELFRMMLDKGVLPDGFAFSAVLQWCVRFGSAALSEMVHAQVVVRGFLMHAVVGTSLLNLYAKLGKCESYIKVFNSMTELNTVTWNAMISGFTSNGLHTQAFGWFIDMIEEGVEPNSFTFLSVSKAAGQFGDINKCREVHRYACKWGLDSNTAVGTALIDMYSKCRFLSDAQVLFYSKFTCCPVNTPWNAMITGYSQAGFDQDSLHLFATMRQNDVKPDVYTFSCVFNSISALKCPKTLAVTHGMALKFGYGVMEISSLSALADAYAKCESIEAAEKVFNRMEEKDKVSWITMITAYCQYSVLEKALAVFSQMRNEGFAPNHFTFSSVITACRGLCLLEYGQQVHALICKATLDSEACIGSALIDMYAKCGNPMEAKKIREGISNPDTVTWTAIISTYAQHGLVKDALQLFRKMEHHVGMVDDGLKIFHRMEDAYNVVPEMEHYACVVDLLGRHGCLDEAMEFIEKMSIKPNEMVRHTLLGACRIHGNAKLGETAAQMILSIQPEHPSAYVLLSNTYLELAHSWISVRGEVHKFYAGDQQHPEKDRIYTVLQEFSYVS